MLTVRASSTPVVVVPSGAIAVNLYLAMR